MEKLENKGLTLFTYSLYFELHSTGLINDIAPGADIWITSGTTGTVTFRVVSVAKS